MKKRIVLFLFVFCTLSGPLFSQVGGNLNSTKKVAILEVANADGDVKRGDLLMILGSLTTAVTQIPGYKGYERRDVASILGEQNFQRTGMVNDEQIKRIGEMEGAQYVLASEVAQMSNGRWAITAKMLDVESAEISRNAIVQTSMADLEKGCLELATKLFGKGEQTSTTHENTESNDEPNQPALENNYTETTLGINMQMVYVEGGEFMMGCTSEQSSDCYEDERKVRRVTLNDYYIGKFEVTQEQWQKVMGTTIEQQREFVRKKDFMLCGVGPEYPMYYVSWEEASAFCEELSRRTGKRYRLPTEAQWEYAARGGNKNGDSKYSGSSLVDIVAWYDDNSNGVNPVGRKQANLLGIHDMSGNLWEWCRDWYSSNYSYSDINNPQGASGGIHHVKRGGSWFSDAPVCRVSTRGSGAPDTRGNGLGFRVVCEF